MTMELLMAIGVGALTTAGVYLVLRAHSFAVILGLTLLSYAVNLFVFASGGIKVGAPPRIALGTAEYAEPLAQALVLTAIVISFAMTALVMALAMRARLETGDDRTEPDPGAEDR
jgi:multicomponent K+:H+ antiporter subunit C